eukprot:8326732-Alexandrium_andersonii.AAC.1
MFVYDKIVFSCLGRSARWRAARQASSKSGRCPMQGRLGWLPRARPNRSGEVWSVRVPEVETPISVARY